MQQVIDSKTDDLFNFNYHHPEGTLYEVTVTLEQDGSTPCITGILAVDEQGREKDIVIPDEVLLREWELELHIRQVMKQGESEWV